MTGGYSDRYLNTTEVWWAEGAWQEAGQTAVPRQGAATVLLDGRPTVLGGFHDYDQYPTMVEQFHQETGDCCIIQHSVFIARIDSGFWFPLKRGLRTGRRYFGVAAVPETLFPGCGAGAGQ